jgi:hypothetical protein
LENVTRLGAWLLGLGIGATIAGGLTIDVALLLLLTPLSADRLAEVVLGGIALALAGLAMIWVGKRCRPTDQSGTSA